MAVRGQSHHQTQQATVSSLTPLFNKMTINASDFLGQYQSTLPPAQLAAIS